jgi:hypothetical protein
MSDMTSEHSRGSYAAAVTSGIRPTVKAESSIQKQHGGNDDGRS